MYIIYVLLLPVNLKYGDRKNYFYAGETLMGKILVSACLAGVRCKYSGGHNLVPAIAELVRQGKAVPVCPESLGGLTIPRPPAEIQGGDGYDVLAGRARVMDKEGRDVTAAFIQGARAALARAREVGPEIIVLKERSPSCGSKLIYDGNFSGATRPGPGVTTALIREYGYKVISEEEFKGEGNPSP
ncbi:uncharacterized conserved protein [Moorella thermoacetica Y72]|uniref:Uncharacterized conserved protein n=2 Tax=Neomoorella thermoacetica TaxID=1525 RepID=A0A0S6UFV6_NEOTH|nr:uncharacterized conserved protein [Moorella thermoacetica Y72]